MQNARLARPFDEDDGRGFIGLDELDGDGVVVDLATGQRGDGMIGQGGTPFPSRPRGAFVARTGADLCVVGPGYLAQIWQ